MVSSRCCLFAAWLVADVGAARVRPSPKKVKDCYSKYDGMFLLHLNPCTPAEAGDVLSQLEKSACTLLDDEFEVVQKGCAETEVVCSGEEAAALEKLGLASIVSADAGANWRESSGVAAPYGGIAMASNFYGAWQDLEARMARVESLVLASDGVATIETVGQSLQGRDIKIVRFSGPGYSPGGKKIFVTFNIHAREWIAGMSGVYTVEHLISKVKAEPNYLAGMEVVLMPMANPDGFVYSTTTDRMHRKNLRNASSRCVGVDLNRNWDAHWASGGSSSNPCSDTYHGPSAGSEPETKVIAKVMNESPMTVYIDVHAYSNLILSAYGYTSRTHPRHQEYRAVGKLIQTAIKESQGSRGVIFTEGPIAQVLYSASGSTVDYADDRDALGICFELRPGRWGGGGFAPPASDIIPGSEECYAGILAAIDYAHDPPATEAPTPAPPGECLGACQPYHCSGYPQHCGGCSFCQ